MARGSTNENTRWQESAHKKPTRDLCETPLAAFILYMSRKYTNKSLLNLIEYRSGSGSDTQYLNLPGATLGRVPPRDPCPVEGQLCTTRFETPAHAIGGLISKIAVLEIRIRSLIRMFLALLDPDPLVRGIRSAPKCSRIPNTAK